MATEMKTVNRLVPAHAVNRYLWSRIEANGYMSKTNYGGLTPILPVEEIPTFIEMINAQPGVGTRPFIVYSWSRINNGQAYWMKTHNIAYSIRSSDDEVMGNLINMFEVEFEDQDVAARRVNEFIATLPATSPLKRFRFTTISVQVLGAQMPAGTETGTSEALTTIAASYVESTQ